MTVCVHNHQRGGPHEHASLTTTTRRIHGTTAAVLGSRLPKRAPPISALRTFSACGFVAVSTAAHNRQARVRGVVAEEVAGFT